MISRIDLRGTLAADLSEVLPRAPLDVAGAVEVVRPICEAVRDRGKAAVRELTARFDGVELERSVVPRRALDEALHRLDARVRAALEEAIRRARIVHEAQLPVETTVAVAPGALVTERYLPVERVGLYVPGGMAAYPSSVVMNVVPAQIAGVASIAVASPPRGHREDRGTSPASGAPAGLPHPAVLAACTLLGVDEVHAVGGAQAIAMFAYGTEECPKAAVVTGPGNVYVAAAKRLVRGLVGVDSEAGPTEIAIVADASADPAFLAADLIAQAEHDELAACLLVTPDVELIDAVEIELSKQVPVTPHRARVEAALTGQSAFVLVDDLDAGLTVIDSWAPEHLEIVTVNPRKLAERVRNAGAIFIGPHAPVSLGDYLAGSNHVLPTGGTARHSGGLSVLSFLRTVHVVDYSKEALAQVAPHIDALGEAEGLPAHVEAVRARVPR